VHSPTRSPFAAVALVLVAGLFAACAHDSSTAPTGGPLAGLSETTSNDSASDSASAYNQSNSGPGYFHGTVFGTPTPGPDSMATAPRIANVSVTIYQEVRTTAGIQAGTEMGSVLTNTAGQFTLPTLPAGDYVVTLVPPSDSPYHGMYASAPLNGNSPNYPWWVVLSKR
jgi:hypothetical protein